MIGFVLIWRKLISPLYGDVCRYYPSCSTYGLGSLQNHGLLRGAPLTVWRILRCNPWSLGGVDYVDEHLDCADAKKAHKTLVGAN